MLAHAAQPASEDFADLHLVAGLAEEVVHIGDKAGIVRFGVYRERDDGHSGELELAFAFPDLARGLETIHDGHVAVHKDEIVRPSPVGVDRLSAVSGDRHVVPVGPSERAHEKLIAEVVLRHEQTGRRCARANSLVGHSLAIVRFRCVWLKPTAGGRVGFNASDMRKPPLRLSRKGGEVASVGQRSRRYADVRPGWAIFA